MVQLTVSMITENIILCHRNFAAEQNNSFFISRLKIRYRLFPKTNIN